MDDLEMIAKDTQTVQALINEHFAQFKAISKYEQVEPWKSGVQAVIPDLDLLNERLHRFIYSQEADLAALQASRTELPITKKLFASRKDEKTIEADIAVAHEAIEVNERTIATLHEMMNSTPSSAYERKEILKILKALKKQLIAEKRAVDQQIRAIKIKARLDLAQWKGVSKGTVGKAARHQRASIRLMKKAQLEPQEEARATIKHRLSDVNQRIKWVSSFSSDEE